VKYHSTVLGIVGSTQLMGYEDVMCQRNYTTTAKSLSNMSAIYKCAAKEFYHIVKKDDKIWG
jgi:hypothetical protein